MTRYLGACLIALVTACVTPEPADDAGAEGGGSTGGPQEPGARIVGQVDVIDLCGTNGATAVSFRATRIGCEPGPPAPCTLKTDPYEVVVGDAATCPGSHTALEMTVVVPGSGRYHIEAQALTDTGYVGRCFGPGTEEVTPVTKDQVDAAATIAVLPRSGPCPPP